MKVQTFLLILVTLLFAGKRDLVLSADSLTTEHLERTIVLGGITDTFQVNFDQKEWSFTKKRNATQDMYEGVELGKDTLASTAILYGLRLYNLTDSTLIISGQRQVKVEGRYFEKLGRLNGIVVIRGDLKKVTLGKTKRQRLLFPIIALSFLGAVAAFSGYNNRD